MRLALADEVLVPFEPRVRPDLSIASLIEQAISRVAHVGPQDRCIVLGEAQITTLEDRLQCPSLGTAAGLIKAVDTLADVKVQGVSLQFTPSQLQ